MQPAGLSASRLTALTNAMQGYVERGEVAGVVSMVWRRGEIGYFEPLGWRDEAAQLPMERDTLFRIASMTKPVTSAAILMLIEEDRLALDTPISLWLPELSAPRVLRDPAGPLDETDPARASLTVLDLLTHRAGFAVSLHRDRAAGRSLRRRLQRFRSAHGRRRLARPHRGSAADVPARLTLALRHRDRCPRRADRTRERHVARRVFPDADFRAARHARHRFLGA